MSKQAMIKALDALEYHVAKTRPIEQTSQAIAELRAAIDAPVTPVECMNGCQPKTICDFCQPSASAKDATPEDEYAYDLFWHALNYKTAHPMDANRCWGELQDCVNRLIKRGVVWE